MTTTLTLNVQTRVCDICFDREDTLAQANDPGSRLITCVKCKSTVHVRCYGEASPCDMLKGEFTCAKCQASLTTIQACFVCLTNCGFLKQLDSGKWVHPICALCSNDAEIDDYSRMNYSIIGYSFTYPIYSPLSCAVCASNKGHLLYCSHKACRRAIHPHCAFLSRAKYLKDDPKSPRGWLIQFDLTAPDSNSTSPELCHYLQEGDPTDIINLVLNNITEPEAYTKCTQGKFAFPVLMAALDNARQKTERKPRGGSIRVMCEDHKNMRLQCICGNKQNHNTIQKSFLVCCSSCDTWFHSSCIGLTLESYKQMRTYVCTACCRWQGLKTQYLLNEALGKRDYPADELAENEWRVPLYCPGMSSVKITDLLLIASVWTRRAKVLLGTVSKTTLLYAHILHSAAIPLCFDTLKALLERKLQTTVCFELSLQSNDMQYGVQSIMDSAFRLKEDSVKFNEKIGKVISDALAEYESKYQTTSQYCKMLRSSKELLALLGKCQQLALGKRLPFREAAGVLQELETLVGNKDDFQEIAFLHKQIALTAGWNAQVFSAILNPGLQKSLPETGEIPESSVKGVGEFVEKAKKALSLRAEKQVVQRLIEEGNALTVVPDEGVTQLENELKKSAAWELEYARVSEPEIHSLVKSLLQLKVRPDSANLALDAFEGVMKWGIVLQSLVANGARVDPLGGGISMEPISVSELENIIQIAEKLPLPPKRQLDDAKALKKEVDCWTQEFESRVRTQIWGSEEISAFLRRGQQLKVRLNEIDVLRERLLVVNAVEAIPRGEEKLSIEYLRSVTERAGKIGCPPELLKTVEEFLAAARTMAARAKALAEAQSASEYRNISEIYEFLQKAQSSRIVLSDLSALYQITFSYEWYGKVLDKIQGTFPDYEHLDKLDLADIQNFLQDAYAIQPLNGPAVTIQIRLQRVAWAKRTEESIQRQSLTEDTFSSSILREMELCEAYPAEETHAKYISLCSEIKRTKEAYLTLNSELSAILQTGIDAITKDEELEGLIVRTRRAGELAREQRIKFGEFDVRLRNYESFLEAYQAFWKIMASDRAIPYDRFMMVYEGIAGEKSLKLIVAAQAEIQIYKEWVARYQDYIAAKSCKNPTLKKCFDIPTLQQLVSQAESSIPHIDLEGRIEVLRKDVEVRSALENSAAKYIDAVRNATSPTPTTEEIVKLLDSLSGLEISSESLVSNLGICRWVLYTRALWESKQGSIEDWNSLLNERHFLLVSEFSDEPTKKLLQTREIEEMIDALRESTQLAAETKDLLLSQDKGKGKKQSTVFLGSMLERLNLSHVDFRTEIAAIKKSLEGAQKIEDSLGELRNSRADIGDYEKLKAEIGTAETLMPHIENELVRILISAKQFDRRVENAKSDAMQRKARLSYRVAEDLLKDYNRLQFRTPEGENLKETYSAAMKQLEEARAAVKSMKSPVNMDEVMQVAEKIKRLPIDLGNEETKLETELWRVKYEGLVTHNDRLEYKPLHSAIKGLISEANQLKELNEPSDREKVRTLEDILADAKRDIGKIFSTFSVAELANIEKALLSKYIDYSEFVIEQRTRITLSAKRETSEQPIPTKDPRPRRRLKQTSETLFTPPPTRSPGKRPRKSSHIFGDVRCKCKAQLASSFKTSPVFETQEKAFEKVVEAAEEEMFREFEDEAEDYLHMEAKIDKIVALLRDYPHTTKQIVEGKLPLYRLCKVGDSQKIIERIQNLERALERKQSEQEKEATNREQKQKNADRLDSLIRQIDFEAEAEEREKAREESEQVRPLSGPEYLTQANLQFYQDIIPVPAQPQNPEPADDDVESLESLEMPEGQKRVFSSEDEEEAKGDLAVPAPMPMPRTPVLQQQKPVAKSASNSPPYSLSGELSSSGKHKKKHVRGHSKLAPLLYDPMSPEAAATDARMNVDSGEAEPGAVYKVWNGVLENGKQQMTCDMYTNEDIALYLKVPAFSTRITIDGRGKISDVTRYLYTKRAKIQSRVLKGWVSPESGKSQTTMDKYAEELEHADKCGVIDIKEIGCCIYLIPWTTRNSAFIQSWDIFPIGDLSLVKFAYFFALKHVEKLNAYRTLQPIIVKRIVNDIPAAPESPSSESHQPLKQPQSQPQEEIKTEAPAPQKQEPEKKYVNLTHENVKAYYEGKDPGELGPSYMRKVQTLQSFVERNKQSFLVFMKSFMMSDPAAAPTRTVPSTSYVVYPPLAPDKAEMLIENMKCSGKI